MLALSLDQPLVELLARKEDPTLGQVVRSAIFRSSVLTSRKISEANRRRRRAEAPPRDRMPRRMRAALSAESFPATPPGTRSLMQLQNRS